MLVDNANMQYDDEHCFETIGNNNGYENLHWFYAEFKEEELV